MTRCGSCVGGAGGGSGPCTCFAAISCEDPDTGYVNLPFDNDGNYISTPDSAANSITGDIDLRAKVAPANWSSGHFHPSAKMDPVSPHETSWDFRIDNGILGLNWEDPVNGTLDVDATAPVPFISNEVGWVRATLDVDNGAGGHDVTFYTSEDGIVWTQVGAVVNDGGFVTSIVDTAQPVIAGNFADLPTGAAKIYRVEIRDGINGTLVALFDANEAGATAGTQTPGSFVSSTGETWTVNGPSWVWGSVSCVIAEGNGSISHPFQFHSSRIPNPRPFGFIQQTVQQSNIGAGFVVPFNSQPYGIEGGMTDLTTFPTRLTAPADGVYLVGAFVNISADATDEANIRVFKNDGVNSFPVVEHEVDIPDDTVRRPNSLVTLIDMVAGNWFELRLDGSATMDLLVVDNEFVCRPTLWAQWMGAL